MPILDMRLLGSFEAGLDNHPLADAISGKQRALLAYLGVEARPHHRETLAGLLWSDQPNERALHSLRQALSSLRKALGENHANALLLLRGDTVQLNGSACTLDVRQFQEKLAAAQRHYTQRAAPGRLNPRALQQAVSLYRGNFLDQLLISGAPLFEEWVAIRGEALRQQAVEALAMLAEYHERRGEYTAARQRLARLLEIAPWEETAQRELMRLLALDGQWSAAQTQFNTLRRYLSQELGVAPAPETAALFDAIRCDAPRSERLAPRFPLACHNLPPAPTPFVGREEELDDLAGTLADPGCRLLTLLGPGGIGKTRLALEAARDQVGIIPQGVYFVPLESVSSAEFLVLAIAEVLGVKFFGSSDPQAQLFNFLRQKELLLVLDSFEHLITAPEQPSAVDFLVALLQQAPGVKLLVTSRTPLELRAESVMEVSGLSYPSPNAALANQPYSALALFEQAARRVQPHFDLQAERPAVERICQLLEGMPLGIELSAAAVHSQPCAAIARQIEANLGLLATTMRDVPARHRSLRAVFEHSWGLLTPGEQQALRRLSVFRGGFTAQAAGQIASAGQEILKSLADQSLLRLSGERYDLHGLVRQFAAEKLAANPSEEAHIRQQHSRHFAASLHQQADNLRGDGQLAALEAIAAEVENVRTAWQWATDQKDSACLEQAMTALGRFYEMRSWFREGREAFAAAAAALQSAADARLYGLALSWQAWFEMRVGNLEAAQEIAGQGLALLRAAGRPVEVAFALNVLGSSISEAGDFAHARSYFEEVLTLEQADGTPADADRLSENAFAMIYLGHACRMLGDFQPARQFFEDSLTLYTRLGDQWGISKNLSNLAMMSAMAGELAQAAPYFEQSLSIYRTIGDRAGIARCLHNLSNVAYLGGDYPRAKALRLECLEICRQIGFQWGIASTLKHLGDAEKSLGDLARARQCYKESLEAAEQIKSQELRLSVLNSLGNLLVLEKELDSAKRCYRQALEIAVEIQSVPVAVDVLAGIGEVLLAEGKLQPAGKLLAFAASFPNSDQQTKDKACLLLDRLAPRLTAEEMAQIRRQTDAHSFEAAIHLARSSQA